MDIRNVCKKFNNIYWFLIDGLRPDFLHIDEKKQNQNFIDQLCSGGTVFDHVVTAGGGTFTSMHAIFTALLPSYNGVTGWDKSALRSFNQEIFSIADYLQLAGYETFRYDDLDLSRETPMSGFKRWEGGGYKVGRVLRNTRLMKTERRDHFIEEVNLCKKHKFVYQHLGLLHELNNEMGTCWTSDDYAKNVEVTAKEFEKIFNEYDIGEKDLVIVSSDHGVILDMDFIKDKAENGSRQYEQSVNAFFALIGENIPSQSLSKPIAALDEVPTILHLVLGEGLPISGQGNDRYDYLFFGRYQNDIFFREIGTWGTAREMWSSTKSDTYYLRDGKWKYVYGIKDPRCEWLINLEENQDYEVNLKDQYPELVEKYHQLLKEKFDGAKSFQYQVPFDFCKADIIPVFSLILDINVIENATIESLLDMSGPYYELIVKESEMTLKYRNQYKMRYVESFDPKNLQERCRGEWLVRLTENGEWSEYFLSDLYRYIQCHRNRNVKIVGEHYTAVRKEEVGNCNGEGIELRENNQVRDIRYLHKDKLDKKYILFGCGDIGKEAVDYFGAFNVAFFADNNAGMTGREICGKRVLSFEEMKAIRQDYTIMITTKAVYANEISKQLEDNGIYDYWRFEEYERSNPESCWESGYRVVKGEQQSEPK